MTGIEELAASAWATISGAGAAEGTAAAATAASAAAPAAAGMTAAQAAAYGLGSGIAGAAASKLLAPKTPGQRPVTAMPDQQAVDAARRRSLVEQMSRRGRASTVLSDDGEGLG